MWQNSEGSRGTKTIHTLPKKRSHTALARGARTGVRRIVIPLAAVMDANAAPYLPSLSRILSHHNGADRVLGRHGTCRCGREELCRVWATAGIATP